MSVRAIADRFRGASREGHYTNPEVSMRKSCRWVTLGVFILLAFTQACGKTVVEPPDDLRGDDCFWVNGQWVCI
jgi:hypothetical protein